MNIVGIINRLALDEIMRGSGGGPLAQQPVSLEPPFSPFRHRAPGSAVAGRRASIEKASVAPDARLRVVISANDSYTPALREQMLLALGSRQPIAFEVWSAGGKSSLGLSVNATDASRVTAQINSHYPEASVTEADVLTQPGYASEMFARCYRLRESYLFQTRADHRTEVYAALTAILNGVSAEEFGLYQVLFQPVRHPWQSNITVVASDPWDPSQSSFVDIPDLPRRARSKIDRPLFAVSVRLAASSPQLLTSLERGFISQFEGPDNALVRTGPLFPPDAVFGRYALSPGMILNARELAALVHLPDPAMLPPGSIELASRTARAPGAATEPLVSIGVNRHRGEATEVGIDRFWTERHVFIEGATGTGKTTLLMKLLGSLMERGFGLAFLDYAGDAAEELLDLVPENRVDDVVYFNPGDRDYPPALNVLQSSDRDQEALASELMVGLKRIFRGRSEFGPRMEWLLRQTVRALLASDCDKTLRDIPRFLTNKEQRRSILSTVADPDLRDFWSARDSLPPNVTDPIVSRLSTFLDRPTVRNIVTQPGLLDLGKEMNAGKILVFNLSKGILGEENAQVLGSFILSKLQLAAMARAELSEADRKLFVVACDEFQNVGGVGADTTSIRSFLSEARKYGIGFVAATQFVSQLDRDIVRAIFGNVGTVICLRCGQEDAQILQREMGAFTAEDLLNLDTGQAIMKMGRAQDAFNVDISKPSPPGRSFRDQIVKNSRKLYCRHISELSGTPSDAPDTMPAGQKAPASASEEEPASARAPTPSEPAAIPLGAPSKEAEPPLSLPESEQPEPVSTGSESDAITRDLITYLEHVANSPFTPLLQRDADLTLTRYKGASLRKILADNRWVRQHKANTGRRSGQLLLLEVTDSGRELLSSMGVRTAPPRGRGGFLHRYYAHKLKEFAEATWTGCTAKIEDDSRGRPVDVGVTLPETQASGGKQHIAFEVFMTGEQKELTGIARDVELFDRVIVCVPNQASLESLRSKAIETFGPGILDKVTFSLMSHYLTTPIRPGTSSSPEQTSLESSVQIQKTISHSEKSRTKPETETERQKPPAKRRGRKRSIPLMDQVQQAYAHIHDLDWLEESSLVKLPEVQLSVDTRRAMPFGLSLRSLLVQAARQVIEDVSDVPDLADTKLFLERYLEGHSITEIARELDLSREWVSRAHRKQGLELAGAQFVRLISRDDSAAS